ncbi:pyridoxal-phosphate dependent enzyme [Nonomuraea sp. PA05]|uniref:pyridoxal-phosphate dependent enzyme n=1 Tax=Nonomuraea sp. PA05 TaxID=2604466 RepID=UPI00165288A0|nr:pyridoxal-phosphate dependent enzyme [Nonomuraea sp. PA05]
MNHAFEIRAATRRIGTHTVRTPFHPLGKDVLVKREDLQVSGSFKIRGAVNTYLTAARERRERALVTVSTGNTGRALCAIGRWFSVPVHVFVLEDCDAGKLDDLRRLGATVHVAGRSFLAAGVMAREFADEHRMSYCSSGADWDFLHGLGSIVLELHDQHPDLDTLFVPVGGGGLAAAVGTAYAALPEAGKPRIIGVQAANSRPIHDFFHFGRSTAEASPTMADCLAGEPEADAIILDVARSVLADVVLVSEPEIELATKHLASYGITVEPGAAAGYAAHLAAIGGDGVTGKTGVLLTGMA